jgi:hypothetical protein
LKEVTRLFVVLDSGVEEEWDNEGGVFVVPVVGELIRGHGGVALKEALVHRVNIYGFYHTVSTIFCFRFLSIM